MYSKKPILLYLQLFVWLTLHFQCDWLLNKFLFVPPARSLSFSIFVAISKKTKNNQLSNHDENHFAVFSFCSLRFSQLFIRLTWNRRKLKRSDTCSFNVRVIRNQMQKLTHAIGNLLMLRFDVFFSLSIFICFIYFCFFEGFFLYYFGENLSLASYYTHITYSMNKRWKRIKKPFFKISTRWKFSCAVYVVW